MAFERGKKLPVVGTMGTGKNQKVLYKAPPKVSITGKGDVNIVPEPTIVGPADENPADAALKTTQTQKLVGESKRTGGFKYKELNPEQERAIADYIAATQDMRYIQRTYMRNKGKFNPYVGPLKGLLPQFARKQLSPPFDTFMESEVKPIVNNYIKAQTGAARGFVEMSWMMPIFPQTTDTPKGFELKTKAVINNGIRNVKTWSKTYKALGYNPDTIDRLEQLLYVAPGER